MSSINKYYKKSQAGFTYIEAIMSITLTLVAAGAISFGVSKGVRTYKSIYLKERAIEELIKYTSRLLSKQGFFSTIIPVYYEDYFFQIAKKYGLFCNRACYIKGNQMVKTKRLMLEFSFTNSQATKEYLTIEKSRHTYTDRYIALCKDFYLGM